MKASSKTKRKPEHSALVCTGVYEPLKNGAHFVRLSTPGNEGTLLPLLPHKKLPELLPGERIIVRIKTRSGQEVAQFQKFCEPRVREFTGVIRELKGRYFLHPDDLRPPIQIRTSPSLKGYREKRVRLEIEANKSHPPFLAKIIEELPPLSPLQQAIEKVISEFSLPRHFSNEVIQAAEAIPELRGESRVDLSDLPFVTIDGADARDYDDAVCALPRSGGYELYVSIADVAAYVSEGEIIDRAAYHRATSIYLVDQVIPMLPERLCNELLSLLPGKPRPVQGVQIFLNRRGIVEKTRLFKGTILSKARLTYTQVSNYLEREETLKGVERPVKKSLKVMKEITELLLEKRQARGGLDFDLPESEFVIGLTGEISEILYPKRRIAHKLIEEFMILANGEVANALSRAGLPLIYRCHAPPSRERYAQLRRFAEVRLGLKLPVLPSPSAYQMILKLSLGSPLERLLQGLVLRSLAPAQYSVENIGHFGLNLPLYCHFTSPIRRYADLVNHRLFSLLLSRGGMSRSRAEELTKRLTEVAQHCTEQEIKAAEVERRLIRLLKAQFMNDKVGERFHGVISGVAPFGIFVELNGYMIDGLVPLEDLPPDYYHSNEDDMTLKGEHSSKVFAIGDEVEVELKRVDLRKGHLDFHLLSHRPVELIQARDSFTHIL